MKSLCAALAVAALLTYAQAPAAGPSPARPAPAGPAAEPAHKAAQAAPKPVEDAGPSLPAIVPPRPKAGPVAILPSAEVKRGMKGIAWTVFEGTTPEPVPVEIVGLWKNSYGPRQDIILAKLGGKALRTNVAGGMSGSPVYIDGKLAGAIAMRISVFSPDAVCGITPIEQMLEIREIDGSKPAGEVSPQPSAPLAGLTPLVSLLDPAARLVPIETPLMFAGFHESTLRDLRPWFDQMGVTPVQGGAAGSVRGSKPATGWENALQPGEAIAGVLVGGDLNVTGLGTVTYNDGKRVLAFGHSFFNLGPVEMPMSRGEVLMVLASQFQPNKFANATEVVGALAQDRHAGILGRLGETAKTIPVSVSLRLKPAPGAAAVEKKLRFDVFSHPRWTPFLMMLTVYNSLQDLSAAAADEATFRLRGTVDVEQAGRMSISSLAASGDAPMPPAMQVAAAWADRFSRLYQNPREVPRIRQVNVTVEMEPERRVAAIESAWLDKSEAGPGGEVSGKVLLRPWRGERIVKPFRARLPEGLARGEYRILVSDSDTLNRAQTMAGMMNRTLDLGQTVALVNQERPGDRLYISLVESRPTAYNDDKALPALPPSVLGVMQSGRSGRPLAATPETARTIETLETSELVSGSASLRLTVK